MLYHALIIVKVLQYFPYKPRRYQKETINLIYTRLKKSHLCLHAATGFGKTPVILTALMPYLNAGYRVIWAVRTGNETDRPIEELKTLVSKSGLRIFGLSYRGKKDMCLLARDFSEKLSYSEVSFLCSVKRKQCPYYKRFKKSFNPNLFFEKGPLIYTEIYELSKKLDICPYFVQRELLKYADVASLSYNYVVDIRLEWSIRRLVNFKESILVVDEAHNLQNIELGSDTISLGTIERSLKEIEEYEDEEIKNMLNGIYNVIIREYGHLQEDEDSEFNPLDLVDYDYIPLLEKALKIGEEIRLNMLNSGKRPRSSLYHFSQFMLNAVENTDTKGIAFIVSRENNNLYLHIWDMRSAEILSERWKHFRRCIFCSGTLEPIDAFAETIGLNQYSKISVPNIYARENVAIYLLEGLTTRGEELKSDMAKKYVETIRKFLKNIESNTAIFTASYRIQNELINFGLLSEIEKLGLQPFVEQKDLSGQSSRKILQDFKRASHKGIGVLIAPMGGRFAEGADFPGEELQAVFLVGIPFEKPTRKVQLYVDYYKELYGDEKGILYAYILPAIRRASQALGRAIRSPDDKAVLVLGDERYEKYKNLLPEYVEDWYIKIHYSMIEKIRIPWKN